MTILSRPDPLKRPTIQQVNLEIDQWINSSDDKFINKFKNIQSFLDVNNMGGRRHNCGEINNTSQSHQVISANQLKLTLSLISFSGDYICQGNIC